MLVQTLSLIQVVYFWHSQAQHNLVKYFLITNSILCDNEAVYKVYLTYSRKMGPADSLREEAHEKAWGRLWCGLSTQIVQTHQAFSHLSQPSGWKMGFPPLSLKRQPCVFSILGSLVLLWKEHIHIFLFDNPGRQRSKIVPNYDEELALWKWNSWVTPGVVVLRPQPRLSTPTLLSPPYTTLSSHECSLQWTTHLTSFLLSYTWRHFPGCIFKAPLTKIANKSLRFKFL